MDGGDTRNYLINLDSIHNPQKRDCIGIYEKDGFMDKKSVEFKLSSFFNLFRKGEEEDLAKGNFLARIFGIFNELPVRIWCGNEKSIYKDLGRPTLHFKDQDKKRHFTYDFLFEDENEKKYVVEQKCEISYQKYEFLTLKCEKQLLHHIKAEKNEKKPVNAFNKFLEIAENPQCEGNVISYKKENNKSQIKIDGAILIWGSVEEDEMGNKSKAVKELQEKFGFVEILSVEKIISDLIFWKDKAYLDFLEEKRKLTNSFFDFLAGQN